MRSLKDNNIGSVVPIILFVLGVFGIGALYSLFFLEIALPTFSSYIPDGDAKTFILMLVYSIPLVVIVVGVFSLFQEGLKKRYYYGGMP